MFNMYFHVKCKHKCIIIDLASASCCIPTISLILCGLLGYQSELMFCNLIYYMLAPIVVKLIFPLLFIDLVDRFSDQPRVLK